jgi:ribosomal protein S8
MTDSEKIVQLKRAVKRALEIVLVHEQTIVSLANSNAALRYVLKQQGFLAEYDAAYHQEEHRTYQQLQSRISDVEQGLDFLKEI